MNLENMARLSYYREVAPIGDQDNITLVMKTDTQKIYVKKVLHQYKRDIYELIMLQKRKYFPMIYELVEDEDTLYVIEEYIAGDTLESYIDEKGRMDLHEAKVAMKDICAGIDFLHHQDPSVIHRDLKPGNIMLDKDGVWKIIDLNTARFYVEDAIRDTEYLGTKDFAAPEQFGFKQTDVRTDIYALGLLFHYMLTGASPVEHMCPGQAGEIVQKCILFEPDKRYQSVSALCEDIMNIKEYRSWEQQDRLQKDDMGKNNALDDREEKKKHFIPFLPPGFRSLKPWKMIVGVLGYVFILWMCFTMDVTNSDGVPAAGLELFLNHLAMFIWLLLTILLCFNYMNIHKKMPLLKSGKWWMKCIGCVVYSAALLMILVFILVIIFS